MTKQSGKPAAVNGKKHVAVSALEGRDLSLGVNPSGVHGSLLLGADS